MEELEGVLNEELDLNLVKLNIDELPPMSASDLSVLDFLVEALE